MAFDEEQYVDAIPPIFEYLREKTGFAPKLLHDVHSHLTGINAVELSRRLQPVQMYFVEDILPPEQIAWYRNIRQICSTPHAVGEVFSHPEEVIPLITDRQIDFIRCRVAAIGGITPLRKLVTLCELFGVKTAFQEGGENDPVNQMASYHLDLSSSAFGIQEENHFGRVVHDLFPGMCEIRKGYLYGSGKPGLGLDIDEAIGAKFPLGEIRGGGAYCSRSNSTISFAFRTRLPLPPEPYRVRYTPSKSVLPDGVDEVPEPIQRLHALHGGRARPLGKSGLARGHGGVHLGLGAERCVRDHVTRAWIVYVRVFVRRGLPRLSADDSAVMVSSPVPSWGPHYIVQQWEPRDSTGFKTSA